MPRSRGTARLSGISVVQLREAVDFRGHLCVVEADELGFDIRRVYFISGVPPAEQRGGHAHRRVTELLVAAAGEFDVVCDDGRARHTVHLEAPRQGLLLPPLVWRELAGFASGSICLVLASESYDEQEYIRTYADFRALVRERAADGDPAGRSGLS
jgi:WxcM-like, C-terminal